MRIFVTGITGMIGSHLADFLATQKNLEIYGFVRPESSGKNISHLRGKVKLLTGRMEDSQTVYSALKKSSPDVIFHLAAQSSPFRSWQDPIGTFNVNVNGTIYLLEAKNKLKINPITYIACSSAAYGYVSPNEIPIKESRQLRPLSPYGVSKAAQEMLGIQYFENYKQKNIMGRFFNQIGPRQDASYAVQSFCKQVVQIEKGVQEPVITVGNLSTRRDFLDVRDGVRAIWALTKKGKCGEVYHICSGKSPTIKQVLDLIISKSKVKVKVHQDKKLLRPSDEPILQGDNSKLKKDTGWNPIYPLSDTINAMLNYWREM